ncbi:MAG: ribosome rescue protein RqcH [Methanomassiliicoccales archaeon]|jgi:predicted ribosome quality control (RQC) complex YloA/Tae2 family protein
MKTEMSAFDILAITEEMQSLIGGHLDKIFQWERKNILFRINVPGVGKKELLFQDMKWLYIAGERPETPDSPTQFAVHLRKHLSNGRIASVRQKDFDRIVIVEIQKEKTFQIVLEIFGEGNLIVNSDGTILNCVVSRQWKHRDIRPGAEYKFPPPRFNPITASLDKFRETVRNSTSDAVRTLATSSNLGGQYAEETCLRAGIDKSAKAKDLTDGDIERMFNALREIVDAASKSPRPCVIVKDGMPEDVTPFPLIQYTDATQEQFSVLSEAIQSYLSRRKADTEKQENEEILRLKRQLDKQKETIEHVSAEIESLSKNAETLYVNYVAVSNILSKMRQLAEGATWEEITERGLKILGVKDVNPPKHQLTIELEGSSIQLDYTKGVEENANGIYERTKELKGKLDGALQSVKETESRIRQEEKGLKKEAVLSRSKKTKVFWFESYKWFITSGGKLVIAGRDARTNDQVVKKHMTPADRFAHADVHGAPSIVIKEGAAATEEEMTEACIFALAHSKAWNAGAMEGSSYWVLPDQVSKTPEPGDFVPRGAFIIRGKRNYLYHLPIELAIGEIKPQGERKIMCGPRSSIERVSTKFVVLAPGKTDRNKMSALLAKAFEVPEEEISRILPPGDVDIRENKGMSIEGQ